MLHSEITGTVTHQAGLLPVLMMDTMLKHR